MMAIVLALTMLAAALAGGLALSSRVERQIAAAHRRALAAGYAAESAASRVVTALAGVTDWDAVPGAFTMGDTVPSPEAAVWAATRTAVLNGSLAARYPLGPDTPMWRVVALHEVAGHLAVVWVADDPADTDGQAGVDSNGRIMVRAEARGVAGAARTVEVHLQRDGVVTRRLSWREIW